MNRYSCLRRVLGVAAFAALALAVAPQAALAHGIADSARDKTVAQFVPLGIEHMLLGFDHLLFIAGIVLLADTLWRAAKLISLFVLGHSLTLLVATLSAWQISATLVDVVIALSVVFVGVLCLRRTDPDWTLVGFAVFGFGLIHGLGLSTRLQHIGLPDDGLFWRVVAFNVGVEIGQLLAIAVLVAAGALITRRIPRERLRYAGALAFIATGLIAAVVLAFQTPEPTATQAATGTSGCWQSDAAASSRSAEAALPRKAFYRPADAISEQALARAIAGGRLVIRYDPALPAGQRAALQRLSETPDAAIIGAPSARQSEPVRVHTAQRTLTCQTFDLDAVRRFNNTWVTDPRTG